MSDKKNPYASAVEAYGTMAGIGDQRAMEGRVLLKAAAKLEALAKRLDAGEKPPVAETGEILEYNQKLWQLFVEDARNEDHPLPQEIKNNIASLALFIFKRTMEALIEPKAEKLQAMIEINRNIAAGLMKTTRPLPGAKDEAEKKPKTVITDSMA